MRTHSSHALGTAVILALLLAGARADAQVARSQFNGTVTDTEGGVLVGATVVAVNVQTNVAFTATTTDAGVYVIPYLPSGTYRITVTADGFRPTVANDVVLRAAQTLTIDFQMNVDALTEELTVAAPVIETGTAEIGRYVSNKEYQTWPVPVSDGQRQIQQFIFSSLPGSVGDTFEGSINGGRNYSHEILVEGMPLGRNLQGGSNNEMSPPTEAVQEFKLQTGTIGAEYGGGQTAVANFVVKSGTNDLHGAAAYYFQDDSLDANSFVSKALNRPKPDRTLQNWALALGGPITLPRLYRGQDRSFFFATFEKTHEENQLSTGFRTLPTRELQAGDFSRLLDPSYTGDPRSGSVIGTDALGRPVRFGQIYDPRTTRVVDGEVVRDPFPDNRIPREFWDTVARNTIEQELWDLPQLDRLINNQPALSGCCPIFDQKTFAVKVDQVMTPKHRASFYVNREWRTRNNSVAGRYGLPPGKPTNLYQLQKTPSWLIRATENWVITDNLLHRFAIGYNRFGNNNRSVYFNQGWPSRIGLTNMPDTTFPRLTMGGSPILGNMGNFGSNSRGNSDEGSWIVQDDITFVRGRHNVKAGFEGRFYYVDNDLADATANFNFLPAQTALPGFDTSTGHSFASFLLGAVASSDRAVQAINTKLRERDYSFYVQDDYKITSRLTLNLGLRWQMINGVFEKNGYVTNLDLTRPNPAAGNLPGALRFADEEGRKTFIDPYRKQLQPRLGVAYAISPTMALSGGYSVSNRPGTAYTDGEFGGLDSTGYNGQIVVNRATFPTPNPQDPVMYLSDRYPDFTGVLPNRDPTLRNNQSMTVIVGNEAKRERYHNFNVTLRRALGANVAATLAYIGARGTDLPMPFGDRNINRIPYDALAQYGDLLFSPLASQPQLGIPTPYPGFAGTVQQALRPYPQFLDLTLLNDFKGKTRYDSLQATVERRYSNGFALLVAYTWSRTDDLIRTQDGRGEEWSKAAFRHVPHFLKLTWIYDLPIGPGRAIDVGGVLGQVVGGWTLTGIHNYRAGNTLAVFDSRLNGAGYSIRPNVVSGVDQVIYSGGSADTVNGTPYLNPDAFALQEITAQGVPLSIGSAPPQLSVRGPALFTEDLGLLKRFSAGGERSLEFRADFINVLNRSGLGTPDLDVASANFGRIFGVAQAPRRIQLSLRMTF